MAAAKAHPLAKHLVVAGSIGGFWAAGVLAMTSTTYLPIYIGTGLVLAANVLLLWWYAPYYRVLHRTHRRTANDLTGRELTIISIVILVSVAVPVVLWFSKPDWFGPKSRLVLQNVGVGAEGGKPKEALLDFFSNGDIAAKGPTYGFLPAIFTPVPLSIDDIDNAMRQATANMEAGWKTKSETYHIQPGTHFNYSVPITGEVDQQQFATFKQFVYIITALGFHDDYLPGDKYRVIESCFYYAGVFTRWTPCPTHHGYTYIHD